jgi:succinyl-diaminopimelate desuccinylase
MDEIKFLQKLLQINSSNPPGNEHQVTEVLIKRAETCQIPYQITKVAENRSNFSIKLTGRSNKRLILCGHMDTVSPGKEEWIYPPYSGKLVGSRLYGRGASDMKSGLAAMYLATEQLFLEQADLTLDVEFLATAGEEVDSCGARKYIENYSMDQVEGLIIGEPTNEKIVIGHKGALWTEIITYGKTAHGSMPGHGVNAIEQMIKVIHIIEKLKLKWRVSKFPLGESSLAITKIDGGIQTNVIPDQCTIHVDIRSVPPQTHTKLLDELQTELIEIQRRDPQFRFKLNPLLDRISLMTNPESKLIQCALDLKQQGIPDCTGVSYYTDGAVLNSQGLIQTLIYGPGDERLAHQPNEWIDIRAYLRTIDFYKQLIMMYSSAV